MEENEKWRTKGKESIKARRRDGMRKKEKRRNPEEKWQKGKNSQAGGESEGENTDMDEERRRRYAGRK